MMVLCACVAVAVLIQTLCAVAMCGERAIEDERVGRLRLGEKDEGLASLRQMAMESWGPMQSEAFGTGACASQGCLEDIPSSMGWAMKATVCQNPSVSRQTVSAWMERGRDGIDLPVAVVVAGKITASADRSSPWIEVEGTVLTGEGESTSSAAAVGYVAEPAVHPLLGQACTLVGLSEPWRLDQGWAVLCASRPRVQSSAVDSDRESLAPSVALGSGAITVEGRPGSSKKLAEYCGVSPAYAPSLVIVSGGATLDACSLGDFYGVIVVDEGSLSLDGTIVHGAVFATGTVDLGDSERLVYSQSVLRWATDRSLNRVRLLPGSRRENVE